MSFIDLTNLEGLSLWDLPLETINSGAFHGLSQLKTIALTRRAELESTLLVENGAFNGLNNLHTLYVDDHRLCCHFGSSVDCITLEPRSPLFACGSLMQNTFLRISMWVLGISAVIGNLLVIISRYRENIKSEKGAVQSFLVLNLALADFWMGIYMLIIAGTDIYYGDRYFEFSEVWQSSIMCKVAGCLSLISSESSVGFLTVISVDRFLSVCFPFSHLHLTKKSSRVVIAIVWLVIISIGLVANILADGNSEFYGLSDVCIGLPLITRPTSYTLIQGDVGSQFSGQTFNVPVPQDQKPAWYFSIALFLGVNLICFVIVLACYIAIFIVVTQSARNIRRSKQQDDEIKMATKMAVIVGTDFCCWFPIIIMGIMSQTGAVVIPLSMYVWSVVFILPINSSLNPYLYTLAIYLSASKKSGAKESSDAKTISSIADTTM
ncbi:G-protein coupled receptor GRL101-like [Amphiura filiformis]|uniref:G-protein coupled receptor GRL101-like n=1 Tax=Amphiura filiformis TaxID=82378 RepID=UPI003B20FDB6